MHDLDEEIREIKKEIIESRGLIIKTNNLTNALSADIKSIAKRQAGYERTFSFNSAAAYVLFAALAFAGLHTAYDVKVRAVEGAKANVERRAKRLKEEVAQLRVQIDDRIGAEGRAESLYKLIREGKRADAIRMYPQVEGLRLSHVEAAFFRDAVDAFRSELAMQSYREGLQHARAARWPEAARAHEEALSLDERAPQSPAVNVALAEAYAHLDRAREAVAILQRVQAEPENRSLADDVLMQLASAHIALGEYDDAREALRTLVRRFPQSAYIKEARDLYQVILRRR